jgi:stage V sporulation protein D (sporulation-specific penicillin-binding protein)
MAARRKDRAQYRLLFILIVFVASLAAIAARLVIVQQVDATKYTEMAIGQRLSEITLSGERGAIYDRNGAELAINLDAGSVYATPYFVDKPDETAVKLARILNQKPDDLKKKLTEKSGFVYLARQLDMDKVDEIKALKLPGINILPERKRFYPGGAMAAHVIGYAGVDNQGLGGVEASYDHVLSGKPGRLIVEGDPAGAPIPGGIYSKKDATEGDDIYLTIDKDIQYKAELELNKVVKDYSAKGGSIIVMNPTNGEILAMASAPGFNANDWAKVTEAQLRNNAIATIYEPGSTAKIVTAAAAVDEQVVGLDEMFSLPAEITVGGQSFGEYDHEGKGEQTISGIIAMSSNVGSIELGMRVGKKGLYKYLTGFGLGDYTGIDLPSEEMGIVPVPDDWSETSIATIPYGQGISATSLQMLNAVATIAYDGVRQKPHVLKTIEKTGSPSSRKGFKQESDRAVTANTAATIQDIMVDTVEKGTGKNSAIPGYMVGGKTGTAQKSGENGYEPGKYVISFVGFVSNLDPQLAIIVCLDEPQATGPQPLYAATIAAPVFRDLAEFSINRLKIAPGSRENQ